MPSPDPRMPSLRFMRAWEPTDIPLHPVPFSFWSCTTMSYARLRREVNQPLSILYLLYIHPTSIPLLWNLVGLGQGENLNVVLVDPSQGSTNKRLRSTTDSHSQQHLRKGSEDIFWPCSDGHNYLVKEDMMMATAVYAFHNFIHTFQARERMNIIMRQP